MSDDYNDILIDVDWRFPAPKARKRYVPVERAENAEAAIERVRKLCDDFEHEENLNGGIGRYAVVRVDRVRSALDGAS